MPQQRTYTLTLQATVSLGVEDYDEVVDDEEVKRRLAQLIPASFVDSGLQGWVAPLTVKITHRQLIRDHLIPS